MSHFLRITAIAQIGAGNTAVNTFHYSADGGGIFGISDEEVAAQANTAIGQLKAFYQVLTIAFLTGDWVIGGTVTEHQTGQPTKYVAATPQVESGASGVHMPTQLAGCISWRTGLQGRSHRGRSYIGPLTTDAISAETMNPGWVAAAQGAGSTLISAPGISDLVPCVYSALHDTTEKITQATTTVQVRTMRSRN